jgi:capsular polysaccharide biosynthesis protein
MNRLEEILRHPIFRMTKLWTVAGAVLLGALLGAVFVGSQSARYEAETVLAIAPSDTVVDDAQLIDIVGSLDSSGIPATVAGMAASESVVAAAVAALLPTPEEDFADYDVDATPVISANLVDVRVSGPDARTAAALTNTIATEVQAQFAQLYRVYQLKVLTPASVPSSSGRPSGALVMLASAALAGAAALWVLSRNDQRRAPAVHAVADS